MSQRRSKSSGEKSKKDSDPGIVNHLIQSASAVSMSMRAESMEKKHQYKKNGKMNPYEVSAVNMALGRKQTAKDLMRTAALLAAADALDESKKGQNSEWQYTCEDGSEFCIYPEEYDTEEEYDEALEEAKEEKERKYGWRKDCGDGCAFGVDPEDYETEEEYAEALKEKRYSWRKNYQFFYTYDADPEDYETEEEFLAAIEEEEYSWREKYASACAEYGLDPQNYLRESSCQMALKRAEKEAAGKNGDAKENSCQNFYRYEEIRDGLRIVGADASADMREMVIPAKINGKNIVEIGASAFKGNQILEKVVLPDHVRYMGSCCFSCCRNLKEIVFPDGPLKIGQHAFQRCPSLKSVVLPKKMQMIAGAMLADCENLTDVVISEEMHKIYFAAFKNCPNLKKIRIPDSVQYIAENAFESDELTILCTPGSYAWKYASEHGINCSEGNDF